MSLCAVCYTENATEGKQCKILKKNYCACRALMFWADRGWQCQRTRFTRPGTQGPMQTTVAHVPLVSPFMDFVRRTPDTRGKAHGLAVDRQ